MAHRCIRLNHEALQLWVRCCIIVKDEVHRANRLRMGQVTLELYPLGACWDSIPHGIYTHVVRVGQKEVLDRIAVKKTNGLQRG